MSDKFLALLDNGHGTCILNDPAAAKIVATALHHFDDIRYRLWAWCIMPNHVHVIVEPLPGNPLPEILRTWKSFTANQINKLLGQTGTIWQKESFDHVLRNHQSFQQKIDYALHNPQAGHLQNWPWTYQRPK